MQIVFRFKSPIFVTFARDGFVREEAIRYVAVRGPIAATIGDAIEEEPENAPDKVRSFMRMLDLRRRDEGKDFVFLSHGDIDVGVEDAYRAARWRALDFIWGKKQIDNPLAGCPRSFDGPSEDEAKARMMEAVGFDFTSPDEAGGEEA